MKIYKIIIALFFFSVVLSSCTKDVINDLTKEEKHLTKKYVADDGTYNKQKEKNE